MIPTGSYSTIAINYIVNAKSCHGYTKRLDFGSVVICGHAQNDQEDLVQKDMTGWYMQRGTSIVPLKNSVVDHE